MSSRNQKGSGNWSETYAEGTNYLHPAVATSGIDHQVIQLLYLDPDPDFTGNDAQPVRGAILYSRSEDGGQTWDPQDQLIEGLGPDQYLGFTIGAYAWARPLFNTVAFVAGDFLTDLVLMKSIDGGNSWQKTVIWEHPYPFFEKGSFDSDSFYCNNGGISVTLDYDGNTDVAFTLAQIRSAADWDTNWYAKEKGGVVYWNESRPAFSNDINALNPYGHADSEMDEDYSLIGWTLDMDGDGEVNLTTEQGVYPTPGLCTMPQISMYDNGLANYRHLWARGSFDGGDDWGVFLI